MKVLAKVVEKEQKMEHPWEWRRAFELELKKDFDSDAKMVVKMAFVLV